MRRIEDRMASLEARHRRRQHLDPRTDPELAEVWRFLETLSNEELDALEKVYRRLAEAEQSPTVVTDARP
jgi:hypothetical protein